MAAFEDLFPLIRMHARNCPEPAMEDALRLAAIQFCEDTRWLRETRYIDVVSGETRYALSPTDTTTCEVFAVKAVEWNGNPLDPKLQEEVADEVFGFYFIEPPNDLLLSWTPTESSSTTMQVRLILQILEDADSLPDALTVRWKRALSYGAMEHLFSMKDAAWYWPEGSVMFGGKWQTELGKAQVEADRQHTPQGFRVVSYS